MSTSAAGAAEVPVLFDAIIPSPDAAEAAEETGKLLVPLLRFQRQALHWMVQREDAPREAFVRSSRSSSNASGGGGGGSSSSSSSSSSGGGGDDLNGGGDSEPHPLWTLGYALPPQLGRVRPAEQLTAAHRASGR
jgi:uncharacterized membrane protein YgcG